MKLAIPFVLFALCFVPVSHGQKKPAANSSLKEIVTWMENFTDAHGYHTTDSGIVRHAVFHPVKECTVSLVTDYSDPNGVEKGMPPDALIPERDNMTVSLSDLAPNAVRVETSVSVDKSHRVSEVYFERSDAASLIDTKTKLKSGEIDEYELSRGYLYLDSADSAERLSRALVRAINLCGGKPAPF